MLPGHVPTAEESTYPMSFEIMRRLLLISIFLALGVPATSAADTLTITPPPNPAAATTVAVVLSGENSGGAIPSVEVYAVPNALTCEAFPTLGPDSAAYESYPHDRLQPTINGLESGVGPFNVTATLENLEPEPYLLCGYFGSSLSASAEMTVGPPATPAKPAVEAPAPPPDTLANYGPSTIHVPYARLYAFSISCAALPCRITLSERATAGGRPSPGLGISNGAPVVMNEQPKLYAVWFVPSELKQKLLGSTLKRYGSVTLHVTGTLTDATGKQVVATRTITLRPPTPHPKPKPHKPSLPPTLAQRAQTAVANELKRTYKILAQEEKTHCYRITDNRYKCSWEGVTEVQGLAGTYSYCAGPRGTAIVLFYREGTEVTISFSGRYNACNYPYS